MKKAGNPLITQVLGYQKVTYPDGTPVTIGIKNDYGEIENKYVYKLINLYGEGAFGSEYYTDFKPSVVNNNTVTIKNEIPNNDIIAALSQNIKVDDVIQQSPAPTTDVKVDTPATTPVEISPETKINIYAGTGENADLSNFSVRPFQSILDGKRYQSVEQAFQIAKYDYTDVDENDSDDIFNKQLVKKMTNTSNGAELKKLGRAFKSLDSKSWDKDSLYLMKSFIRDSFEQNPAALEKLLATGNATLTHTQDTTKWGKEFPRLLMEVREEIRPQAPVKPEVKQLDLFDTNNENLDGADESNPCKR
jgi:predicted NAD-dependent protein-ADP-ribosyltransferase YbiA (DUF1768 family)